jgi:hypothetical protein
MIDEDTAAVLEMARTLYSTPDLRSSVELRVSACLALLAAELGRAGEDQDRLTREVHNQLQKGIDHYEELCQAPRLLTSNSGTIH